MTKTVTIAAPAVLTVKLTGKGASARTAAFMCIAVDSYMAESQRGAMIATLSKALGNAPTDAQLANARQEYVVGRSAFRLPAGELPKGCTQPIDRIEHARKLVTLHAYPTAEGSKPKKLRAGKVGYRSAAQHRVIRNAEESWSQVLAELGHGKAKSMAERNADKRAPQMPGSTAKGKGKGKAAAPSHAQLVTPAKPLNASEAVQHIVTQASALLQFSNKHAKLIPADFGTAVQAFKSAVNTAANAFELAKAKADADAAAKMK